MADAPGGLEALRGLHADTAGIWVDARLWIALVGGLLLAGLVAYIAQWRFLPQRRLRREALAELNRTRQLAPAAAQAAQALLLRRIARTVAGDATMHLSGEAWLAALDGMFATQYFSRGNGRRFGEALYAPPQADAVHDPAEIARLVSQLRWRP